jgi:hypothetical protein
MAGLGKKTFVAGEVLRAADVNGYLMDQAVQVYAGAAARGSALGTAISEGSVTWLSDGNVIEAYDGAAWMNVATTGRGVIAHNTTLVGSSFTVPTPLVLFSSTFVVYPNRKYRFSGRVTMQLSATSTIRVLAIYEATMGYKQLQYTTVGQPATNYNDTFQGSVVLNSSDFSVTSGSGTSKTVEARWYGGSNGSVNSNPDGVLGSDTSQSFLLIEDIGAS